jgi:hypothetical protein
MVRHASLFSQLVALFNRQRFYELVYQHRSERYTKGFSSWDQFVAMLFCQLGQAKSLREINGGLASALGKLRHLGVKTAPNKSILSYANAHRPWQLFRICSMRPFDGANGQHRARSKSSDSKTSCSHWTAAPYRCVCRCFPGRSFAAPRRLSNCTCYWITTAICPVSPASPTAKRPM